MPPGLNALNDKLIAIIDDDRSFRMALDGLLRSFGHATKTFTSAEAFLESGEADKPDCVLSDIQMPGLNGIDLKYRLAELGNTVPVIFVTAQTEKSTLAKARESGARCILRKPLEIDTLLECLEGALNA